MERWPVWAAMALSDAPAAAAVVANPARRLCPEIIPGSSRALRAQCVDRARQVVLRAVRSMAFVSLRTPRP